MIQTLEAVIHPDGFVKLMPPIQLPASRRALLIVLEEELRGDEFDREAALLSEAALATIRKLRSARNGSSETASPNAECARE